MTRRKGTHTARRLERAALALALRTVDGLALREIGARLGTTGEQARQLLKQGARAALVGTGLENSEFAAPARFERDWIERVKRK